jgi:hypothetical protein
MSHKTLILISIAVRTRVAAGLIRSISLTLKTILVLQASRVLRPAHLSHFREIQFHRVTQSPACRQKVALLTDIWKRKLNCVLSWFRTQELQCCLGNVWEGNERHFRADIVAVQSGLEALLIFPLSLRSDSPSFPLSVCLRFFWSLLAHERNNSSFTWPTDSFVYCVLPVWMISEVKPHFI